MTGTVLTDMVGDGVCIVTLNRPHRLNAIVPELLEDLIAALQAADSDPSVCAVVLTGSGPSFSAGVDLKRIVEGGPRYVERFLPALSAALLAVFDHAKPVVAAVNGHALAGGCVLAAACEMRLMSGGTIGLAELAAGVPFPTVPLEVMRHAVGPGAGGDGARPRPADTGSGRGAGTGAILTLKGCLIPTLLR